VTEPQATENHNENKKYTRVHRNCEPGLAIYKACYMQAGPAHALGHEMT